MVKFKVINGKWNVINLYDVLQAHNFDRFINSFRKINVTPIRNTKLKKYNYLFKNLKNNEKWNLK